MRLRQRIPAFSRRLAALLAAAGLWQTSAVADEAAQSPDARNPAQPRVLIVLTNTGTMPSTGKPTGYYLPEAAHPWAVFTEAGYAVDFASPEGGRAPVDPRSLDFDDPVNLRFWSDESVARALQTTAAPGEIRIGDYAGIWFAGGHGTMWDFPGATGLLYKAGQLYADGGAVGAVCHGPAALLNLRLPDGTLLAKGREVAAFTNSEEAAVGLTEAMPFLLETELAELGAQPQPAADFSEQVIISGRLVTGQNPASAQGAAEAMVEAMRDS